MIITLRHFLVDSWLGRLVALFVFIAFIGLGGTFMGFGGGFGIFGTGGVVTIGPYTVEQQEFARDLRSQAQYALQNGLPPAALQDPRTQQQLARNALQMAIASREATLAAERNGIHLSDEMIRQRVFSSPEFLNDKGVFDPHKMQELLERNHLDHAFLITNARRALFMNGVLLHLGNTAQMQQSVIDHVVDFYTNQHVVDVFHLDFTAGQAPGQASEAQLQRFYQNHLDQFREPEFRHARIVVMTPETVAASIEVPEEVLHKLYQERERDYNMPETRSVQVLGFPNAGEAEKAHAAWTPMMSWESVQKQFPDAVSAALDHARKTDFPDEALGNAAFSARSGEISGPVKTAAGWSLVHVVEISPPHHTSFEQVRESMRREVQNSQIGALLPIRLRKFQEAVAGSTDLEKIPADLGAVPASGLLDDHGMTPDDQPAPLPGDIATRKMIIEQVFSQNEKTLPHVVPLSDGGGFAVSVDRIVPGRQKNFDEAHTQILFAWQQDQARRDVNRRVTGFYQASKTGGLRQIVARAGNMANLRENVTISVQHPDKTLPPLVTQAVFRLPVGKSAMLEADNGLWVIAVREEGAAPAEQRQDFARIVARQQNQALQNDMIEGLMMSYIHKVPPRNFNPAMMTSTIQEMFPSGGVAEGGS